MNSILEVENKINTLKKEDEDSFRIINNIFHVSSATGSMRIPSTYKTKVQQLFGTKDENGEIIESKNEVIERVENQKVVKTYNKWTGNGSLFNSLRASRPGIKQNEKEDIKKKNR